MLQLKSRPLDLHLAPEERQPTTRKPDEEPKGRFVIIKSMSEMAHYVYEMYQKVISNVPKPVSEFFFAWTSVAMRNQLDRIF